MGAGHTREVARFSRGLFIKNVVFVDGLVGFQWILSIATTVDFRIGLE